MGAGIVAAREAARAVGLFRLFGIPSSEGGLLCGFFPFLCMVDPGLILRPIVQLKVSIPHIQPADIEQGVRKSAWGPFPFGRKFDIRRGHTIQLPVLPIFRAKRPKPDET